MAQSWVDTTYELVKRENLSPPAAARVYAYTAVAMYEVTVPGTPRRRSLAGQLTGLKALPGPRRRGPIDWPAAVAAAAAAVLDAVLPFRVETSKSFLDQSLSQSLSGRAAAGVSAQSISAGSELGREIARHLATWIEADGYAGIQGRHYLPPVGEAMWESTPPNYRPAVEPYWSEVRPLVMTAADEVKPAPPLAFDPDPDSPFGQQAMAPYRQSFLNTDEERAIARFWTDNPGSFTPPLGTPTGLPSGHWMQITSIALRQNASDLAVATEAYARVGIGLHDAFLNCWTWKYRFGLVRPITYIRRYVDPTWTTFVNTPQFPEYTSGHSVGSPAASYALTRMFGEMAFVDDSAVSRGLPARRYVSFDDAAREAAQSRLYGGIHYPMAIEEGLRQGEQVARLVHARLKLTSG